MVWVLLLASDRHRLTPIAIEGKIYLEQDYSEEALAPLRTRVQGFLEIIG